MSKAKRFSMAILMMLVLLVLTSCGGPEHTYKQAQELLSKGEYSAAAEKFQSLGSYEDATTLTMYCKACALCESGNFEAGIAGFESLGNYKDCSLRISYYTARSWDDNSVGTTEFEWMERAKSIYNENPLYLDSAERITALDARIETAKKTLYDDAVAAAEQGQYSTAVATFQRLGNYKDSAQRATYYGIRADEDALAGTTNETACDAVAARYAKMGTYLDCADRADALTANAETIRVEKYDAAMTAGENGQYDTAITAFKKLGSYSDSAKRAEYYAIRKNEASLANSTKESAYDSVAAEYTAMGNYLDCADRATAMAAKAETIRQGKYDAAVALMNNGEYSEAYNAFLALDGYRDSKAKAASIHDKAMVERMANAKVGDYIKFGTYEQDNNRSNGTEPIEWLVLAKEDNRMLVISRYALVFKPYNDTWKTVTWANCTLRKWLNNDFLNAAFNSTEKAMIPTVTVSADKNPNSSTNPGNATQDKVFLLSIPEVNKYFTSNSARRCKATAYASYSGGFCCWWLRSPGFDQYWATLVDEDSGKVLNSHVDGVRIAVRPALWINLEP